MVVRHEIVAYLHNLRDNIIQSFESIESSQERFERDEWQYNKGSGGGQMSVIRNGEVFEKAAVNWSGIEGKNFPMKDASGPFFATGVSLITHMQNPMAPTVHMNIRYFETENQSWFGGGYDLTPMGFIFDEDTKHFHKVAKDALAPHGQALYKEFSQKAKEYFYIPHRQKERGVGGIFFDHYNTGSFEKDLSMWKSVGDTFIDSILPIYKKRIHLDFTPKDKRKQIEYRAHYAEFNLLYDRGTKFGFQSGGNHKAILCSMPPLCGW